MKLITMYHTYLGDLKNFLYSHESDITLKRGPCALVEHNINAGHHAEFDNTKQFSRKKLKTDYPNLSLKKKEELGHNRNF